VEAKYIYNFRKFNNHSHDQLKFLAKEWGVKYTHPYLNKRELAKKLAIITYNCGVNYKAEYIEYIMETGKEINLKLEEVKSGT
jgi:hypothetical protein